MPNHCTHRLIIKGPREDVGALVVLMQGETCFDFDKLIPCPPEVKNTSSPNRGPGAAALKEKYGHSDWYSWNVANWGTKWNAYELSAPPGQGSPIEALASAHGASSERQVEYDFDTAWSPPMPIFEALTKRFPTLTFTWYGIEEQPAWGALVTWAGGEQVDGGICEGSEDEIWGLSEWHEWYRRQDDEDE